ncbi:MAG TPA: lytic transglycosylase domain-containing protein [Burkholderiaceae bacterium]
MIKSITAALLAVCLLAPRLAYADCFDEAARYQHVDPMILRAIAWQESRGHADAVHVNTNGTTDFGMMQVNSIHLRALSNYGISQQDLMKPCVSVYVGAWYLRQMMMRHKDTWSAVGAYHSERPDERDKYSNSVMKIVANHCGGDGVRDAPAAACATLAGGRSYAMAEKPSAALGY